MTNSTNSPSSPALTLKIFRPRLTLPKIQLILQSLQLYTSQNPTSTLALRTLTDLTSFYLNIIEGSSQGSAEATTADLVESFKNPQLTDFQAEMQKLAEEFAQKDSSTSTSDSTSTTSDSTKTLDIDDLE